MAKKILEVHELTTKYITRQGEDVYSVDHVSLDIEEGKSLGIAGESGCGKSTLALSLMGYYFAPLHYQSGEIIIDGKNISGMDPDRDDVWAENIAYSPEGSTFLLCTSERKIACTTQLLGELNIRNILLCASVALRLGMTMEQVSRGIRKIKPIEHRLQLIRHPDGLNVIDDAFNSNIRGARQAFDVLKQFPKQRIIVTPGMVELGAQETYMNTEFGKAMSGCCDTAILVGKKRSEAIRMGLLENGFPEEDVKVVSSLTEATALLREIAGAGDTVLFENDLPDNYSE